MPTRLLLEGSDLRSLLTQVRDEHGAAAKIVSAERVRSGKLFSGPRFELTVEVPGSDSDGEADEAPVADSERADLLALLSEEPASTAGRELPSPVGHAATAAFSEVLAQLRDAVPDQPAPAPAPKPAFEPAAYLSATPAPVPPAVPAPVAPAPAPASVPPALGAPPALPALPAPAPALPGSPADLRSRLQALGLPPALSLQVGRGEAYPAMVRAFAALQPAAGTNPVAGDIIVIVGPLHQATAAADDAVRALRLGAVTVLVASPAPEVARHIEDAGDAARRARRQRGADHPTLVVVDAADPDWAGEVVAVMRADAVWAVVDAGRKPADTARQVAALGRVDAIAVRDTAATADPATPLALGLPVALIDDRVAGPHAWAALLSERLFDPAGADVDR